MVGGGDSAMEEAIFLTKFASKVTVIHRRSEFRASQIMLDRAAANEKIEFVTPAVVEEVLSGDDGKMRAVVIRDLDTDDAREIEASGLFVAIGHDPTTALFLDQLDHDEAGYLVTMPGSTETNVPGVFAAGRRPGPHVPSGDHGGGLRLYGGARRRAVARGARGPSRDDAAPRGRRGLAETLVTVARDGCGRPLDRPTRPDSAGAPLEAPAGGPRARARAAARPGRSTRTTRARSSSRTATTSSASS